MGNLAAAAAEISDRNSEASPMRMCQCRLKRDNFFNFSEATSLLGRIIINIFISETSQEVQSANHTC